MLKDDQNKILQSATKAWGSDFHMEVAVEECAEFILAVKHYKRGRIGLDCLLEEVADVIVCMNQIGLDIDYEYMKMIIESKIKRLKKRVEEDDYNSRESD